MSVSIGPRIGIDGEAAYRRALQQIIQETKTLKSEMKATEFSFDKNASAQEKARAKSKLLNEQLKTQKDKLAELNSYLDKAEQKYGSNSTQALKLRQAVAETTAEVSKLNDELQENSQIKAFGKDLEGAGEKISNVGDTISGIGKAATSAVTVPIVAAGTAAVKSAADFESSFSKVTTIMDDTAVSTDDMKRQIKELSNETGVSMNDIADATYQAISAGQDSAKAVDFVAESLKLAKAGMTDTTTATDVLTTVLNAYGDQAGTAAEVSDTLMTIQNKGKTTIAELGSTMGKVIPTAAMYSVGLDQIAGAYVTTTKNGIGTAESTTYINSMLDELGNSGKKAAKVLKSKTGKSFKELMEDGWDLDGVLGVLKDTADETGVTIGDMFGSQEAAKAAATIVQHTEDFNGALRDVEKSAGTTEKAFKKMQDTTETKLNKAMNELKNLSIDVGEEVLPTVVDIAERVADVVEKGADAWGNLTDQQKDAALKAVGVVAAFGPVASAIGPIVSVVGDLVKGYGTFLTIAGGSGAIISGVLGPLALMGGAFALIHEQQSQLPQSAALANQSIEDTGKKIAETSANLEALGNSIEQTSGKIEVSSAGVDHWRDVLNSCYDESGNLKEGMENLANYALNELNEAMGTDYSTEFIAQAKDSKKALQDLNTEVDNYIGNLKKQAIEEAYGQQYADAVRAKADAQLDLVEATGEYNQAVADTKEAFEQLRAAQSIEDDAKRIELSNQWSAALEDAKGRLVETAVAFEDASANAAQADTVVQGLDDTMESLANGASIESVADQYAHINSNAESAAQASRAHAEEIAQSFEDIRNTVVEAPAVDGTNMQKTGKDAAAKTYKGMEVTLAVPMQGKVDKVTGGNSAASSAYGGMKSTVEKPMTGSVSKVTGGASAAASARNEAQGYMDRNPISVAVNVVRNVIEKVSSVFSGAAHNAQGGIVATEQLSWLAEGNKAEAVIPLQGNRSRALSLYKQVGAILGAEQYAYLPERSGSNIVDAIKTSSAGGSAPDYSQMYAATRAGIENADINLYVDGRKVSRSMRDMGVRMA